MILITGATGLIGNAIVQQLAERGKPVRALVRDPARARAVLPASVRPVQGDITKPASLAPALSGARLVFHAAGLPEQEQWAPEEAIFDRVNHQGTANLLQAALAAGWSGWSTPRPWTCSPRTPTGGARGQGGSDSQADRL